VKKVVGHKPNPNYSTAERDKMLENSVTTRRDIILRAPSCATRFAETAFAHGAMSRTINDERAARRFYMMGVDYAMAGYQAIVAPTERIFFPLEGAPQIADASKPEESDYPGPMKWAEAFSIAVALRRSDGIAILSRFPIHFGRGYDAIWNPLLQAYQRFVLNDPSWSPLAAEATSLAPTARKSSPKNIARYMSMVPTMHAIAARDAAAFRDALVDMLKAHKAEKSRGADKDRGRSGFAEIATGLAALGVDRGLPLEVESEYLPAWMVLGTEPENTGE